uniref:Uncharacterized protein n=1 Tax=Glossina pallidipes TaxID=7398 RepID=A0A1A9Z9A2_GLOPL
MVMTANSTINAAVVKMMENDLRKIVLNSFHCASLVMLEPALLSVAEKAISQRSHQNNFYLRKIIDKVHNSTQYCLYMPLQCVYIPQFQLKSSEKSRLRHTCLHFSLITHRNINAC